MNIIDLNKQFYYQYHNRICQSDPINRPIFVPVQGSAGLELSDINWNSLRILCLRKLTKDKFYEILTTGDAFFDSRRSGGQKYFVKPDLSEISFNPITTVHLNYEFLNPTFEGFLAIFMVFERSQR